MKLSNKELLLMFENKSKYCKKAFESEALYTIENILTCKDRIDVLQLFLPILSINDLDKKLKAKLKKIKEKNIKIEVFLHDDFLSNSPLLHEFFKEFGTVYFFKDKK